MFFKGVKEELFEKENKYMSNENNKKKFYEFFKRYFEKGFNKTVSEEEIDQYWEKLNILDFNSIENVCKNLYRQNKSLLASPSLILHQLYLEMDKSLKTSNIINSPEIFTYNTCYIKGCMLESCINLGMDKTGIEVFLCKAHHDEYWLAEKIVKFCNEVPELMEMRKNATKSLKVFIYHWIEFMRGDYVTRI